MSQSGNKQMTLSLIRRSTSGLLLGFIFLAFLAGVNAAGTSAAGGENSHPAPIVLSPAGDSETNEMERVSQSAILYLPAAFSNFPDASYPFDRGPLPIDTLKISSLAEGASDRWTMELLAEDTITVHAAPGNKADIVLSIEDENGDLLIDRQNNSPPGEVESIEDLQIAEAGTYSLYVRAANDVAADYALLLLEADLNQLVFRGRLPSDDPVDDALPADTDHVWLLSAQSGDLLTITVTPSGDGDAYVEFYRPDGEIFKVIDDNGPGEPETLEDYTVLQSGLYGVLVGEFLFNPMAYQISLVKAQAP